MKIRNHSFLCILSIAGLIVSCDRSPRITSDSQQQPRAEAYHGEIYRSFDGQVILNLISSDECELSESGTTLLCKYTKQSDALRVVATAMGTNQVIYYRFVNQGVQDNRGRILLSPDSFVAATEQARVAQENQIRLQREAQERRDTEARQQKIAFEDRKKAYINWLRKFFAKGQVHDGAMHGHGITDGYPYEFTLTFTQDPKIKMTKSGSLDALELEAFCRLHWHQKYSNGDWNGKAYGSIEDQENVIISGSEILISESRDFGGSLYATYGPTGKENNLGAYAGTIGDKKFFPAGISLELGEDKSLSTAPQATIQPNLHDKVFQFRLNRFGGISIVTATGKEQVRVYQGNKQTEETLFESSLAILDNEKLATPKGTIFLLKRLDKPIVNDGNRHINSGDWQLIVSGKGEEFDSLKDKMPFVAFGNLPPLTYLGEVGE